MAKILNDTELKKLIEHKIIINADLSCIGPNSYTLRLGAKGEYINIEKEFDISKNKKGFKLPTGNSVGITSYEEVDFREETVNKLYPNCALFAYISPITDLSREGIIAHTTKIDAGYKGMLNWTLNNTSNKENDFIYKEKIYNLTIFKLEKNEEVPKELYGGHYQNQTGYIRSKRQSAPKGMKDNEWENPSDKNSPEKHIENLIKSGYPWNILGKQLKALHGEFKTVTDEYSRIDESINNLHNDFDTKIDDLDKKIDSTIENKQSKLLVNVGSMIGIIMGIVLSAIASDTVKGAFNNYGGTISFIIILAMIFLVWFNNKKK